MTDYDVIVVGGGPAGSMAAEAAAKGGAKTLLLEKDRDIGYPVRCGEGVGAKALKQFMNPDPGMIAATISKVRMRSPDNTCVDFGQEEAGYILHRRIFDVALANRASKAGAEIQTRAYVDGLLMEDEAVTGVKYQYMGQHRHLTSKIVIAADGVESRVGRMAGLRTSTKLKDMESGYQVTVGNIDVDQEMIDFYVGDNWAPGGYLWIFPKGDGMANIGLGILGIYSRYDSAHDRTHSFIKKYFPKATILASVCGGIPVGKTLKKMTSHGFMLTGDAAHMVNPVTGGGIITGMQGGQIAGEVAALAIQKGNVSEKGLEDYPIRWHRTEGKTHEAFYRISQTIDTITDEQLNKIAHRLVKTPSSELSLLKIFTTVAREKPKMLLDVTRAFAGV